MSQRSLTDQLSLFPSLLPSLLPYLLHTLLHTLPTLSCVCLSFPHHQGGEVVCSMVLGTCEGAAGYELPCGDVVGLGGWLPLG